MKFSARQVLGLLAAADRQNGELKESLVAELLGVKSAAVGKALDALSSVYMPPFGPDDLIDLGTDTDSKGVRWVYVKLPPGLRVAALPAQDDVEVLGDAFETLSVTPAQKRLAKALMKRLSGATKAATNPVGWGVDPVDPDVVGVIGQAVREGREVTVKYYNKSKNSSFPWKVRPVALVQHAGRWYVDALVSGAYRWLRVDRMLDAALGDVKPVAATPKRSIKRDVLFDGGGDSVEVSASFPEGADVARRVYGAAPSGNGWVVRGVSHAEVLRALLASGLPFTLVGPKKARELLATWVG